MGIITTTIREFVSEEFDRLKKNEDFLTIEDVKSLKSLVDMKIDFGDGKFTLVDLMKFTEWIAMVTEEGSMKSPKAFESETKIQCMLQLWKFLGNEGVEEFVDWVISLFDIINLKQKPHVDYIAVDSVLVIHEMLTIQKLTGMDIQLFVDLMHQVSEEMKLQDLEDEELDDVVPVSIVKMFLANFARGYHNMMNELFSSPEETSKKDEHVFSFNPSEQLDEGEHVGEIPVEKIDM